MYRQGPYYRKNQHKVSFISLSVRCWATKTDSMCHSTFFQKIFSHLLDFPFICPICVCFWLLQYYASEWCFKYILNVCLLIKYLFLFCSNVCYHKSLYCWNMQNCKIVSLLYESQWFCNTLPSVKHHCVMEMIAFTWRLWFLLPWGVYWNSKSMFDSGYVICSQSHQIKLRAHHLPISALVRTTTRFKSVSWCLFVEIVRNVISMSEL